MTENAHDIHVSDRRLTYHDLHDRFSIFPSKVSNIQRNLLESRRPVVRGIFHKASDTLVRSFNPATVNIVSETRLKIEKSRKSREPGVSKISAIPSRSDRTTRCSLHSFKNSYVTCFVHRSPLVGHGWTTGRGGFIAK